MIKLKMKKLLAVLLAVLCVVSLTAVAASAGGLNIPSFDPPNLGQVFQHAEDVIHKQAEGALGGRFSVTIRNPTNNPVFYSFNGEEQIALMPHFERTHSGVGNAEIRFDSGKGDGSFYEYSLPSGKSYSFKWGPGQKSDVFGDVSTVQTLNLFSDS
jgi:hypothetical protein